MKQWNKIVLEDISGKGYIGVKVSDESANKIIAIMNDIGIKGVDKDDLHATVIYDKSNPIIEYRPCLCSFKATAIDIKPMGKPDSEWFSIALMLYSPELEKHHNELKQLGFKPSYDEFVPHISLKYKPTIDECKDLMEHWAEIAYQLRNITLDREWIAELNS